MNKSSTNVWNRVIYRETRGNLRKYKNQLFCTVPDRLKFVLEDIADEKKEIVKQVTLGWSKTGHWMISYDFAVEMADSVVPEPFGEDMKPHAVYHLYLWKWQLFQPLMLDVCVPLFAGKQLPMNHIMGAKLAVVETENNKYFMAHGSPLLPQSTEDESTVKNWLTVFLSPSQGLSVDMMTIHFEYQVQSPYPPFEGSTTFFPDDMILFNTGNAIHVCKLEHKAITQDAPPHQHDGIPSTWGKSNAESLSSVTIEALHEEFIVASHDCFDAEGYIKRVKQSAFKDSYVVDYDLRMVTTLPPQPQVVLLVLIFFQRELDGTLFGFPFYPVLNLLNGTVETVSGKAFNCPPNVTNTQKKGYATGLVTQLRNVKWIPKNKRVVSKEWNNSSVFGGASLNQLQHPEDPIAVVPLKLG